MTTTTEPETSIQPEPAPKPRSLRRRVLSRISIQSKLLVMLLRDQHPVGRRRRRHRLSVGAVVTAGIGVRPTYRDPGVAVAATGGEVHRSRGFADHLHPRSTATEAIEAFTPAFDQLNNSTINPGQWQSIVDYYNNQFENAEQEQTGNRLECRCFAADVEYTEVPAGLLHGTVHRLGQVDQIRRRPGRQRLVGGQCPLQRLLPRDRAPLRVRGRVAARHQRQRRLQRLQGCRPRHQHPHRPLPRGPTARRLPEGAGLQCRRLRRCHRLRRLPARRRANGLDGVAGRASGPSGRRSGTAVPDLQDQSFDDGGQAVGSRGDGQDRRDVPGRTRRPDAVGLANVPGEPR